MNKYILSFSSVIMLFTSLHLAAQISIPINATVVERQCTVSEKSELDIDMGVGNAKGIGIGVPFGSKKFSIILEDCPGAISSATIAFSADKGNSSYLENTVGEGYATGFSIGLFNTENVLLDMKNNLTTIALKPDDSGVVELPFIAAFVRTASVSSTGQVVAVANFSIDYE